MAKKKDEDVKSESDNAIFEALAKLRKQYGDDVVVQATEEPVKIESISTNCFAIDRLLGCGGLPRGRIIEMYGEPSSGKSATSLYFMSEIQKAGGSCVLVDAEYAFNADFASKIGVDVKKLFVSQPATLEEAMDTVRAFISTNAIDLIVVDSVAALVPKKEIEGDEMLKDSVADQARLMNKALRILTGEVARSKTVVIFINHLKEKILTGYGSQWGEKTTTPGGKALKFYASVRLAVAKGEKLLGSKETQVGNIVRVSATKNKVGFPYRKGEYELYYESGVNQEADTFDTALELKVIEKEGNTFTFQTNKIGVGREKAIDGLKKDPDFYKVIRAATLEAVKNEK
jgi:recombination protein RecA